MSNWARRRWNLRGRDNRPCSRRHRCQTRTSPTERPLPRACSRRTSRYWCTWGGILLLILAMFFSSAKKKPGATDRPANATPVPVVQDNTANNIQALHNQLETEKQRQQQDAALAAASATNSTPAQQAALASLGSNGQTATPTPCGPGQVCNPPAAYASDSAPPITQSNGGQPQLTPAQQQTQMLAAKERERLYASRF